MNDILESIIAQSDLDSEIEDFLSHHGVKGQKWGQRHARLRAQKGPDRFGNRNNPRTQRHVDRLRRIASGRASTGDKFVASLLQLQLPHIIAEGGLQGASAHMLERAQRMQHKINAGKKNATDMLLRLGGTDIRGINYKFNQPKQPKVL